MGIEQTEVKPHRDGDYWATAENLREGGEKKRSNSETEDEDGDGEVDDIEVDVEVGGNIWHVHLERKEQREGRLDLTER